MQGDPLPETGVLRPAYAVEPAMIHPALPALPPLTERADAERVRRDAQRVAAQRLFMACLDAMPHYALLLNAQRQAVAANHALVQALGLADSSLLLGRRPGEILSCIHASEEPTGCGTAKACTVCGALSAMRGSQGQGEKRVEECRLSTAAQGQNAIECEVTSAPLSIDGDEFILMSLRDISGEKRREVFERMFFHDVLNTVNGLHGLAKLLVHSPGPAPDIETEYKSLMLTLSERLSEEIRFQRQLVAAERGLLVATPQTVSVAILQRELVAFHACHEKARNRQVESGPEVDTHIVTDAVLLRRVLGNLLVNALEAVPDGAQVTLSSAMVDDRLVFAVHNPGEIPERVALQLFSRSFSTKGEAGRGMGTYSARLFTERYLGGTISFTTDAIAGTTVRVALPRKA
jgi:signal transduction histidine kinase